MASIKQVLVGNTVKITWVSSATVASQATARLLDGSDTMVESVAMTSSGNGHYYANIIIPSSGDRHYVAETTIWVNSFSYKKRSKIRAILEEVD